MESIGQRKYFAPSLIHTDEVETYFGEFINNKREGLGKATNFNGEVSEGQHSDNVLNGWARKEYRDGSIYCGEFVNGHRHGTGSFSICGRVDDTYSGEWENEQFCGFGVRAYPDHTEHRGMFSYGQAHGRGVLHTYSEMNDAGERSLLRKDEGIWVNGVLTG
jgi:hypothetical protein